MGSFGSATFGERGGGGTYPAWTARELTTVRQAANGSFSLLSLGADVQRLALVVRVTAAELGALYDAVLDSRSLTFGYETCNAFLESVDSVAEQGAGHDVYFATLNLVRL